MEEGEEKDELVRLVANQMKRCLVQWGHGSSDDEKVASDLARFTDGAIQLDLDVFKFDKINLKELQPARNNKRKSKAMECFVIEGGHRLSGTIVPQGAKNEALQVISATLLTTEKLLSTTFQIYWTSRTL